MSAEWPGAVQAVKHKDWCRANYAVSDSGFGSCDCDRDARIAKGVEAVRASDRAMRHNFSWHTNAAALRAFIDAAGA